MQEAGHRRTAGNGKGEFAHLTRQMLGRFLISTVRQRLRLLRQFVAFQVGVSGDAVEVTGMQPVLAA